MRPLQIIRTYLFIDLQSATISLIFDKIAFTSRVKKKHLFRHYIAESETIFQDL